MPRFLIMALLAIPAWSFAAEPAHAPADLAAFQQQAAEVLEANRIPGAGIALIRDGEVLWAGGIGYARRQPEQHAISATRFRIGSVTKVFTALAVLKLVEEGRLSLDRPVREMAPEVPIDNPWAKTHPVRVAHLLEHTAGFDDMHFRNMNSDEPLPETLAGTVQALSDELRVRWQPGVKHSYSNPGYAVAGYLVEKITGKPFHRYLQEQVLLPLGIEAARWGVPDERHFAQGYFDAGEGGLREVEPRAIRLYPAGELSMSSADLARLVQFFLKNGQVNETRWLSAASIERMETPRTTRAAAHGLENGYGMGNYASFRKGRRLHGHNGGLDGFVAEMSYSRDGNFGYVLLLNRADVGTLKVLGDLAVSFLAVSPPPEPGELDSPGARLSPAIAGCYRMSNSRNQLLRGLEWLVQVSCVEHEDGQAVVRHPVLAQATRLVPVRDDLLRESDRAWPSAVFMQGGQLEDALQWSGIYFERATWPGVVLPIVLTLLALLLMASSALYFPVWLVRWWRGSLREAPALSARALPFAASVLFALGVAWAMQLELSLLDSANVITWGVFVSGTAFAVVSFLALYRVVRTWNAGIHPAVKWHSFLVALACASVAAYLVYWRLVPLRLWAW